VGDACDNCPEHANPAQHDANYNGIGNECDRTGFRGGGVTCTSGGDVMAGWWIVLLLAGTRRRPRAAATRWP
jgi:hypothetical protein